MPKVKKQSVSKVQEKARTARAYANDKFYSEYATEQAAMNLSRGPKKGIEKVPLIGTRYPNSAEKKAAKLMQNQRAAETERSAARAAAVTKRAKTKAEKAKTTRALTGQASKPSRKVTKRSTDLAKKSNKKK